MYLFQIYAGGRRLALLIRRTAAAAAGGGTNPIQSQPHAACSLHRHYSSGPLARSPDPDTASYLVASCGLSPAAAAVAARWTLIRSTAKADAVLALLRQHGFSDGHIARLIRIRPDLLIVDPDKIIRPKLEFFDSLGVGVGALTQTNLLCRSLDDHLVPCVDFIRGIVGTDAGVRTAISHVPYALRFDLEKHMRPAVEALRCHGLSEEAISKLVITDMGVLGLAPHRIAGIFEDLDALGLCMTDSGFVRCFSLMCRHKRETIWRRLVLYQSFGLSQSQVAKAFRSQPSILDLSDEAIQRKVLFFRDKLKIAPSQVIAWPKLLSSSMEKNILPKCAVLNVLMSEGKIRGDINLYTHLSTSSKDFFRRYVKKYEDIPDVVRAYEGKIKFKGFLDDDTEGSLAKASVI
ncbi:unnamed protein product [Urochloa decumbens]|uniref:Uncharacterized protein n=1 Tax=Urochloa decumbens TaxID=240449 RepID=A0ABC8VM42_9POAL